MSNQTIIKPSTKTKSPINFFVPATLKSTTVATQTKENTEEPYYLISGWASTPDLDMQNEIIDPIGIDADYFINNGWVNYEHSDNIIGVPTSNSFTDSSKGLFVEAKLFKDNPLVQRIMELHQSLEEINSDRKLGFSIEGKVKAFNEEDPRIIDSIWITEVAVTTNPANTQATWDILTKSILDKSKDILTVGTETNPELKEDFGALTPESLSHDILNLTYGLFDLTPKQKGSLATNVLKLLDEHGGKCTSEAQINLIQLLTGISYEDSKAFLNMSN